MIGLAIFIVMVIFFLFYVLSDTDQNEIGAHILVIFLILMLFGFFTFVINEYTAERVYSKALDHNPYEKEYVYKQIENDYVIIDSTYTKKK